MLNDEVMCGIKDLFLVCFYFNELLADLKMELLPDEIVLDILVYLRDSDRKRLVESYGSKETLEGRRLEVLSRDLSLRRCLVFKMISPATERVPGEPQLTSLLHTFLQSIYISGAHLNDKHRDGVKSFRIDHEFITRMATTCGHNLRSLGLTNGSNAHLSNSTLDTIAHRCPRLMVLDLSSFLTRFGPERYDTDGLVRFVTRSTRLKELRVPWSRHIHAQKLLNCFMDLDGTSMSVVDVRGCREVGKAKKHFDALEPKPSFAFITSTPTASADITLNNA
jgi:hypothetical protein